MAQQTLAPPVRPVSKYTPTTPSKATELALTSLESGTLLLQAGANGLGCALSQSQAEAVLRDLRLNQRLVEMLFQELRTVHEQHEESQD